MSDDRDERLERLAEDYRCSIITDCYEVESAEYPPTKPGITQIEEHYKAGWRARDKDVAALIDFAEWLEEFSRNRGYPKGDEWIVIEKQLAKAMARFRGESK